MTVTYILLPAAEADLRDIIRYTRQQWGVVQARTYITKIRRCVENEAAGQGQSKDMAAIYPGLRMVRCEHHYIFCLRRDNAPLAIVAIFHERRDLMVRLADRLRVQQ